MESSNYRPLGKSGLIISPMALGTMTFGNTKWGTDENESKNIFNAYVDLSGNFIDTADIYTNGKSEELVGKFISDRKLRDQMVVATKFSFNTESGNPNAGGNGRKNLYRSLERSLKRLNTDYVDLYWVHAWDMITPVDEILHSLNALIQEGKIRYFGFSNIPAWYNSKSDTLAKINNMSSAIALQMHYSLISRTIEREHIPSALDAGQGIIPWSPLAYGFLSGKYKRDTEFNITDVNGRLNKYNPLIPEFTEQHWKILAILEKIAKQTNHSIAQISLAWLIQKKGVSSVLVGAKNLEQLKSNIESSKIKLSQHHIAELDGISSLVLENPYSIFSKDVKRSIFGGHSVSRK